MEHRKCYDFAGEKNSCAAQVACGLLDPQLVRALQAGLALAPLAGMMAYLALSADVAERRAGQALSLAVASVRAA